MAQKRLLDKKISINEDIASLPIEGQLLFTWMIPHADDFGLLPHSARSIKALVIPMHDITTAQVEELLYIMEGLKLLEVVEVDGNPFYKLSAFNNNQNLRHDRNPQTLLKLPSDKPEENWKLCQKAICHDNDMTKTGQRHAEYEEKIREDKRTEEKLITGDARPEKNTNGIKSLKDILLSNHPMDLSGRTGEEVRIQHEWQDKALRYKEKLNLTLGQHAIKRWMKCFKEAKERGKEVNLEKAMSYLIDYPQPLSNEQKMLFFFKIYENGLQNFEEVKQ